MSYRFPALLGAIMLIISLVAGFGAGEWTPMVALVLMVVAFAAVQIFAAITGS